MSYEESIRYLYNLQKHGIKLGLDNIRKLVSALGNPHKTFRTIHIAGTNGKGSTSKIIASILESAGLTVGLFTSPHLVSFTERISINGEEIGEDDVSRLAEEVRDVSARLGDFSPTFFEVVTAMAFLHFSRRQIDIGVMEVGMGGRLDATNVIQPDVCVITQIGYDHMAHLGRSLREIAREKAGIIKKGIPIVSALQEEEALNVISARAAENGSPLSLYGLDFSSRLIGHHPRGIHFDYADAHLQIDNLHLPLAGSHQMQNASLAIRAVLLSRIPIDHHTLREGLNKVRWPGRLEFIHTNPPIIADGAHNPAAADVLARSLREIFQNAYSKIILICGIMGDKDIEGILKPLLPLASCAIMTSPAYSRAASAQSLARAAESLGFHGARTSSSVAEALEMGMLEARTLHHESVLIVVTGSFYTIGEAKVFLGQKGILTTLRE